MLQHKPLPPEWKPPYRRRRATILALCAWIACTGALGSTEAGHLVAPGETLSSLAQRYGGSAHDWPELQRLNGLRNPHQLRPGTTLRLPANWIAIPAPARLTHLLGHAWVTDRQGNVRSAREGDAVSEGEWVRLEANSIAHIEFADGSQAHLSEMSHVRMDRLRSSSNGTSTRTRLHLEQGRVDSSVAPRKGNQRHYDIQTPFAVASVRGTRFGVFVAPGQAMQSEVYSGEVELRHPKVTPLRLRAGEGGVSKSGARTPMRLALAGSPETKGVRMTYESPQSVRVTLTDASVSGTRHVRILKPGESNTILREATTQESFVRFANVEEGSYVVQIQSVDGRGLRGLPASQEVAYRVPPTPPLFVTPEQGAALQGPKVPLRCTQPEGISAFRLQIASNESFQPALIDERRTGDCHFEASLPPGRYFWRLASLRDASGTETEMQGPFSAARQFEVHQTPPVAPAPISTVKGQDLVVHWAPEPDWLYQVQIALDASFDQPLSSIETREGTVQMQDLEPGRYFVRIRAVDSYGQESPYSVPQALDIGTYWRDGSGQPVRLMHPGAVLQHEP